MSFKESLQNSAAAGVAIGHFNVSDLAAFKAIVGAARGLNVPVVIGVSEGERVFVGIRQVAALVRSAREEFNHPIFLNADHTHSLEAATEAAAAGFDEVLFDGGSLPFAENIERTRQVVETLKGIHPEILVEGEIGYIGTSSEVFAEIPKGAAVNPGDLTTPEQAREFVEKTGVDLLAPAVGNIHGMFANAPSPHLDIERLAAISKVAGVPLVLHGGSGTPDEDFVKAIAAGVRVVHINTEIRVAWRRGLEQGLAEHKETVAPYKILPSAVSAIEKIVTERLKLFSRTA